MRKAQEGFTVVEVILVLAVLVVIGGVSYAVLHRASRSVASSQTAPTSQAPAAAVGTTQSIDNLMAQDAASESAIDTRHTSNDQTNAQSTNGAAANVGGAYDESTF